MNYLLDLIKARPELAIIITGISSVLLFQLKAVPGYVWELFLRLFTVNLEVDSECEAYFILDSWLNKQQFSQKTRNLLLSNNGNYDKEETFVSSNNKEVDVSWRLTTGFGYYIFLYKNTLILYRKTKKETQATSGINNTKKIMQGSLTALTRNKQIFISLVDGLLDHMSMPEGTPIYTYSDYWTTHETRKVRPLESIFLKDGQINKIVSEIDSFYKNKNWYISKGIPYRKGILLSGPPGTGKTSLIMSLASYFNKKIFIVNTSAIESDSKLFNSICETHKDCFIVLEDIDCISAVKDRRNKEDDKDTLLSGITTQGLLNILDGITTPENRLFFMTTNHPEKLDPAFLRPGRVDIHEVLDKLGNTEQKKMAEFFYSNRDFTGVNVPVSPAELQKAFMIHKHDSSKAQAYIESIYNEH